MASDDAHDHDHGTLHYLGAEADDATLARLRDLNPALAENLALTRRWADATPEERQTAPDLQRKVEFFTEWTPGYHAAGDKCATCGSPVEPLFWDRFQEGRLPYAPFVGGLPVHARRECLAGFKAARPDLSPRAVDAARRTLVKDVHRPSAGLSQFFRHDVLKHPPFGLEDWGNSVAEANPKGLDKATMRDIERLLHWVHARLFHAH